MNDKRRPAQGLERKDGAARTSSSVVRGDHYAQDTSDHRQSALPGDFVAVAWAIEELIPGCAYGPLNGKIPLTEHGFHDFSTFADTDADAFADMAASADADRRCTGIGVRLPVGYAALDVDTYKADVVEDFNRFAAAYDLPETLVFTTGRGGSHVIYRTPAGWDRPLRGVPGTGIDVVREHGTGFIVGPGSLHPDTGRRYTAPAWTDGQPLERGHIAARVAELPWKAATLLAASTGRRFNRDRERPMLTAPASAAHDDVATWLATVGAGKPDFAMRRAVAGVEKKMCAGGIHDTARAVVWEAIHLAAEGHPGAQIAVGRTLNAAMKENTRRFAKNLPGHRQGDALLQEFARLIAGAIEDVAEAAK